MAIVTATLGPLANHVGAHFWNLQEAQFDEADGPVDHDVLYRRGLDRRGHETFLPRVLVCVCFFLCLVCSC